MEEISYAKYLASPEYRKYPYKGLIGWLIYKAAPSVEDLQKKYDFTYYSSMTAAVTAVNNGTSNADATKETAVAGVYTDENGSKNVVLLKDTTETATISVSKDMIINLGGHTLNATAATAIELTSGSLEIDGRLKGSRIEKTNNSGTGYLVNTTAETDLVVNAGEYFLSGGGTLGYCFNILGKAFISNANINADMTSLGVYGVFIGETGSTLISGAKVTIATGANNKQAAAVTNFGTATVSNCKIKLSVISGSSNAIGNAGYATVSNCDIKAYSNYSANASGSYTASSTGVNNHGNITISDCHVFGTHSGLTNYGTLYVTGGTYEGYGHGGFYFTGTDSIAYVRNTTMRNCDMPEGYVDNGGGNNGAGFYLGTGSGVTVYMDNCRIQGRDGTSQVFVLRDSYKTLYISNSTINEGTKIRIDTDTNKLYIGKGCNFTAEDTNRPTAVIQTDEVYAQEVA